MFPNKKLKNAYRNPSFVSYICRFLSYRYILSHVQNVCIIIFIDALQKKIVYSKNSVNRTLFLLLPLFNIPASCEITEPEWDEEDILVGRGQLDLSRVSV